MLDDTDQGRVDIINNSILVARRLRNGKEKSVEEAFPWINNLNRTEWKSVWMKDREGGRGGEEMNDSLETRRFLYYYRSILEAGSDIDNVNECRLLSPDNTDKFHIYVMVSTSWLEPGEEQRKLVYVSRGRNYVNVNSQEEEEEEEENRLENEWEQCVYCWYSNRIRLVWLLYGALYK